MRTSAAYIGLAAILSVLAACGTPPGGPPDGDSDGGGDSSSMGGLCQSNAPCMAGQSCSAGCGLGCMCNGGQYLCYELPCTDAPVADAADSSQPGPDGSGSCPFPNFTRDYPPPDGGTASDGGLACTSVCPDPGPIPAGPARVVGCSLAASDGGTVLRCEYAHSCI